MNTRNSTKLSMNEKSTSSKSAQTTGDSPIAKQRPCITTDAAIVEETTAPKDPLPPENTTHKKTPTPKLNEIAARPNVHDTEEPIDKVGDNDDSDCQLVRVETPVNSDKSRTSSASNENISGLKRRLPVITQSVLVNMSRKEQNKGSGDVKTEKCPFCKRSVCHEGKYGEFCARETRLYMKSRGATKEGVHETYVTTYTIALKLDMFRKYGAQVELVGRFNPIPSCMLSRSYLGCLNEFD